MICNIAGFDASALPDLQPQAPAHEAFGDMSFFGGAFDDVPLDSTLWGPDVPAFGTLSVDALFAMPGSLCGSLPGSPSKAGSVPTTFISPLSSPLRAPGSPAAGVPTPAASESAVAAASDGSPALPADAPTAAVPVATSVPVVDILTSYASTGEADVVVICTPRAPKRPAADDADTGAVIRAVRHRTVDEDSTVTAASLESEDIMPVLIAAPLTSHEQVHTHFCCLRFLRCFCTVADCLLPLHASQLHVPSCLHLAPECWCVCSCTLVLTFLCN